MLFNSQGNITSIREKGLDSINFTYENITTAAGDTYVRLKTITDGAGRDYNLGYASNQSVVLTSITDPAGRVTRLTLSGSGLGSITYPDNKTVSFSYESNGILSNISAPDGTNVAITYKASTSTKMVASIAKKYGNSIDEQYSFTYSHNETTVTDKHSRKIKY